MLSHYFQGSANLPKMFARGMKGWQSFTVVYNDNCGVCRTRQVQMRIRGPTFADLKTALAVRHLPLPAGVSPATELFAAGITDSCVVRLMEGLDTLL